ncbi:MAG: hypothetical protein PWP23_2780 [Candidatus Sumerlaeota bacterium]|nr:hypothetical protein [Candidatus Sumerlaeota bacterium]
MKPRCRIDPWVAALALLHGGLSLWCAASNGSVNDEFAAHITAGYWYLKTGVFSGGVANPPLGQLWVALPVWLGGWPLAPFAGTGLLAARLMNVLASGVLVLWVGTAGAWCCGRAGGRLAAGALAVSPTLLAHGSLATIDAPMALSAWAFLWVWWRLWRRPTLVRAAEAGALLGVALAIKLTGILLIPLAVLLPASSLVYRGGRRYARRLLALSVRRPLRMLAAVVLFLLAAWLVPSAAYLFRGIGDPLPFDGSLLFQPLRLLPGGLVEATWEKWQYSQAGNESFLIRALPAGGVWWYYPVVLALKEPLFLTGGYLLAVLAAGRRCNLRALPALVVPGLFLLAVGMNRTQIGARHLLPMLPFMALGFGLFARGATLSRARLLGATLLVLALMRVAVFLPYPLSFASLAATGKGHMWLTDSNADWGQGNDAISRWLSENPEAHLLSPQEIRPGRGIVRINTLNGHASPAGPLALLRNQHPAGRVGGAGIIYDLSEETIRTWLANEPLPTPQVRAALNGLGDPAARAQWLEERKAESKGAELALLLEYESGILAMEGDDLGAYRLLRRASQLSPGDERLAAQETLAGKRLQAMRLLDRNPAQASLELARAAGVEGNRALALEWIERAEAAGLDEATAGATRYWLACRTGDLPEAARLAHAHPQAEEGPFETPSRAIVLAANDSNECTAKLQMAFYAYQLGNLEPAARLAIEALATCPENKDALALLGQIIVTSHERRWLDLTEQEWEALCALQFPTIR